MEENNNPIIITPIITPIGIFSCSHYLKKLSNLLFTSTKYTIDNLLRYNNLTNYYPIFYKNARTIS